MDGKQGEKRFCDSGATKAPAIVYTGHVDLWLHLKEFISFVCFCIMYVFIYDVVIKYTFSVFILMV